MSENQWLVISGAAHGRAGARNQQKVPGTQVSQLRLRLCLAATAVGSTKGPQVTPPGKRLIMSALKKTGEITKRLGQTLRVEPNG